MYIYCEFKTCIGACLIFTSTLVPKYFWYGGVEYLGFAVRIVGAEGLGPGGRSPSDAEPFFCKLIRILNALESENVRNRNILINLTCAVTLML